MMRKKASITYPVRSTRSIAHILLCVVLAGAALAIAGYTLQAAFDGTYTEWFFIIFGGSFGIAGLFLLAWPFFIPAVTVHPDRIEIKRWRRNSIIFTGYVKRCTYRRIKRPTISTTDRLTIECSDGRKIAIDKALYLNSEELFKAITGILPTRTEWYDHENPAPKKLEPTPPVWFAVGAAVCIAIGAYFYTKEEKGLSQSDLRTVQGTVASIKHDDEGRYREYYIHVLEYPSHVFEVETREYRNTYSTILTEVKPYDTIYLEIEANDYRMKITGEQEPSYSSKNDWKHISVYGIRANNLTFLDTRDSIEESIPSYKGVAMLFAAGLIYCLYRLVKAWLLGTK